MQMLSNAFLLLEWLVIVSIVAPQWSVEGASGARVGAFVTRTDANGQQADRCAQNSVHLLLAGSRRCWQRGAGFQKESRTG